MPGQAARSLPHSFPSFSSLASASTERTTRSDDGKSREQIGTHVPDLAWRAVDLLAGTFGYWPDKEAAREIGIPAETWRSWKYRRRKPSTDHLSRLFSRFGAAFRCAVLAPWESADPAPNVVTLARAIPTEEPAHGTPKERTERIDRSA